jgi:hypothetical protein
MSWQIASAPHAIKAQIERDRPGEIVLAIRTDDVSGDTELLVGFNDKSPRWINLGGASAIFQSRDY